MILRKPIVTEKTLNLYQSNNKVTFEVDLKADKKKIAKAIKSSFDVTALNVWVINRLGKKREDRNTRKTINKKPNKRIAIIELKKGDKINLFDAK